MIAIVKIGTSSITAGDGSVNVDAVNKLCVEVAEAIDLGHQIVIVSSGAVTAGVAALRPRGGRPSDAQTLQALSSIGQHRLMRHYDDALTRLGLVCGQVLLVPADFGDRRQYLHARATLHRLLELGVVPIVNENDAIADDEIRFSDNDRIAALVANLLGAAMLILLTDTAGVYDADPRAQPSASLVEEIQSLDDALLKAVGGPGSVGGSGGMASKLAAAHMASRSGVATVIAAAHRPRVLLDALEQVPGVGTLVAPSARHLPSRKLWIAFALPAVGKVLIDQGAERALREREASLLPAGVTFIERHFEIGDAIEIANLSGVVFAKGIAGLSARDESAWLGRRSAELDLGRPKELVHRDDLVVLED